MKVISYLKSVPVRNNNPQKEKLLINFISGVNSVGDIGVLHTDYNLLESDVAVIQGWVYDDISTQHLKLRKEIIDQQIKLNKYVVCADANLFLYADKDNSKGYLRYSFNGVFPNTGIYCDTDVDKTRWNKISKDLGIKLEDYKNNGQCIVLMLQRQGGWSLGGKNVEDWAMDTIIKIRQHSDRPIIIRPHPGDKKVKNYLTPNKSKLYHLKNVKVNLNTPLHEDLKNAWAVVNHNSSAVVGPIIQGYHAFITDFPKRSQCGEVAHTDFSKIESPDCFDRQKWLERISMFHWNFSELEDGTAWKHMRNYIRQ